MKLSNKLFNLEPFKLKKKEKDKFFLNQIKKNLKHHYNKCENYKLGLNLKKNFLKKIIKKDDIPYLPVNIFKKINLVSSKSKKIKIYNSSGTTQSIKSKIFLDRDNIINQSKALNLIGKNFLGDKKKPLIFIDSKENIFDKTLKNARTAAILGFSIFASKTYFVLDKNMKLKKNYLKEILLTHKNEKIIFFGFTSIIWTNFLKKIDLQKYNNKNSILLHGGGWKKLEDQAVSEKKFNEIVKKQLSIYKIINYYGMIEQTGSIFFKCEYGFFHCSILSDVLIRDENMQVLSKNKKGFVQCLSLLPTSYPGNSIITEDIGEIFGEDDCKCKRSGKYFKIYGRAPKTELRGCSDV